MHFSNTYGLKQQQVLKGFFKGNSDIRQAREILTDFGYPKEAAKVVELSTRSSLVTSFGKRIVVCVKDQTWLGIGLGFAVIIGGIVTGLSLYSEFSFYEVAVFFAIWVTLMLISLLACGLIGASVIALLGPVLTQRYVNQAANEPEEKSVLISVAVRTSSDAKDLAREWKEIGGKVV